MINKIEPDDAQDEYLISEFNQDEDPAGPAPAVTPTEEPTSQDEKDVVADDKITIVEKGKMTEILVPNYTVRGELGSLITLELNKIHKDNGTDLKDIQGVKIEPAPGAVSAYQTTEERYAYASDFKSIQKKGLMNFYMELTTASETHKDIPCYLEPNSEIPKNMDMVLEDLQQMGVSVFFNKEKFLNKLLGEKE